MNEKDLEGPDIILNLKEINIVDIDSFNSSGCAGRVRFEIECRTEQGYCEDPNFLGKIKILGRLRKGFFSLTKRFALRESEQPQKFLISR